MRNDSVMLKYAYRILMVVPFAIPVCMGLLEEKYGRIVWLSYVWVSIFIMSLIVFCVDNLHDSVCHFFDSCLWTRWYSMRCASPRPATFAHIL